MQQTISAHRLTASWCLYPAMSSQREPRTVILRNTNSRVTRGRRRIRKERSMFLEKRLLRDRTTPPMHHKYSGGCLKKLPIRTATTYHTAIKKSTGRYIRRKFDIPVTTPILVRFGLSLTGRIGLM